MANNNCLEVSEIFYSIQGESTFSGLPCFFIRLSGCNLQCSYCDSRYAVEEPGRMMSIDEILSHVDSYPRVMVEITGGEPLLQKNVHGLIARLIERGRKVLIETNGSLSIANVPTDATVIMDIKCPDSGPASFHPDNFENIRKRAVLRPGTTEVKFVISSRKDYMWAKGILFQHDLSSLAPVLFSPVKARFPIQELAREILNDALPVRLQVQLHTVIWPDTHRGV